MFCTSSRSQVMRGIHSTSVGWCLVAIAAACVSATGNEPEETLPGNPTPSTPSAPVASLQFDPASDLTTKTLEIGATRQLAVVARDAQGNVLSNPRVLWSVVQHAASEVGSATVDSSGKVAGVSQGWIWVYARSDHDANVSINISFYVHAPIASLSFGVDSVQLISGDVRVLQPRAYAANGNLIAMTPPIAVTSADTAIVSVADFVGTPAIANGRELRARANGNTSISASIGSVSRTIIVSVETMTLTSVSAGTSFVCGLDMAGRALCWGQNNNSQLGIVTRTRCIGSANQYCAQSDNAVPVFVSGGHTFSQLSSGARHACGITAAGEAYCWGSNATGQLGTSAMLPYCSDLINGQTSRCSALPIAVEGGLSFTSITAGWYHTCGLTGSGAAHCWGSGALGNGTVQSSVPVPVGGGLVFRSISAGLANTCGVTLAGAAYCWGGNGLGELGIGSSEGNAPTPVPVSGGHTFSSVSVGANGACGLTTAGKAYCWGSENGLGSPAPSMCPVVPGMTTQPIPCAMSPVPVAYDFTFSRLAFSSQNGCGVTVEGEVHCWNYFHHWPARITGLPAARNVSVAHYSTGCALGEDGIVYCWNDVAAQRAPGQP
jgi:alpha-tubulin suppressor-like RCC1 family protein